MRAEGCREGRARGMALSVYLSTLGHTSSYLATHWVTLIHIWQTGSSPCLMSWPTAAECRRWRQPATATSWRRAS